jgi:hypothetical protein
VSRQEHKDQDSALTAWLREVADVDGVTGASPGVQARLHDEARAIRHARRSAVIKMYALAAGLVVATAMPVWQLSTGSSYDAVLAPEAISSSEIATRFFPLVYSDVPVTNGTIVRVEMSPAAVAALGVEPIAASGRRADVVLADVIVGEDGLARAVRFVRTTRD